MRPPGENKVLPIHDDQSPPSYSVSNLFPSCSDGGCRYQEESRDGLDVLDEKTVMGTDGEDFAAAKARLARGQGNKQAKQASRATELMAREEERKQQFMAALGVDLTKVG
jgi:hypothetical protein